MSNKFTINGRTFSADKSVCIINGRIFIDGKEVDPEGETLSGVVEIRVLEGAVHNLRSDASITVEKGNVLGTAEAGLSATVHGHVQGDVKAGKNVTVGGNVGGDVAAGKSVTCGDVKGSVDAGKTVIRK